MKLSIFGVLTLFLWLLLPSQPITAQAECSSLTVDWPVTLDHASTAFGYTAQRSYPAGSPTALSVQHGEDVRLIGTIGYPLLSEVNNNFIAGIDISQPHTVGVPLRIAEGITTSTLTGNGNRIIYAYLEPSTLTDKSVLFHRLTTPYYIETSESGVKTTWVNSEPKSVQYDKVFTTDLNGIADVYFLGDDIRLIDDGEDGILMNAGTGDCFGVCAKAGSKESLPWFADRVKDFYILPTEGPFYSVVFLLE